MKSLIFTVIACACYVSPLACSKQVALSDRHPNNTSGKNAVLNAQSANVQQLSKIICQEQLSGEQHYGKANSLAAGLEAEAALREYDCAIEKGYDTVELRIQLGRLLAQQLNRHKEAIEQLRIAVQRDETNWRAHWPLAQSLLNTKQYDKALKELQISKQLDLEGKSEGFYFYYTAIALDGLGRYEEALKDYETFLERAKKIEPNSPRVDEVKARVEIIKER